MELASDLFLAMDEAYATELEVELLFEKLDRQVVMNINTMTFVAPNLAWDKARGGRIPQSGAATDEQRSPKPNWAQPSGRQFFFSQTSLLAPYRSISDMRVDRASFGRKIPCRERHRTYVHDH